MARIERTINGRLYCAEDSGIWSRTEANGKRQQELVLTNSGKPFGSLWTESLTRNCVIGIIQLFDEWLVLVEREKLDAPPTVELPEPWRWAKSPMGHWYADNTVSGASELLPVTENQARVLESLVAAYRARTKPKAEETHPALRCRYEGPSGQLHDKDCPEYRPLNVSNNGQSYPVDLALITLPSPDADSVTVLVVSGAPKDIAGKRVRLVVDG
jgi:hypothetical protein